MFWKQTNNNTQIYGKVTNHAPFCLELTSQVTHGDFGSFNWNPVTKSAFVSKLVPNCVCESTSDGTQLSVDKRQFRYLNLHIYLKKNYWFTHSCPKFDSLWVFLKHLKLRFWLPSHVWASRFKSEQPSLFFDFLLYNPTKMQGVP